MKHYRLTAHVTVSAFTDVRAPSAPEAVAIALGRPVVLGGEMDGFNANEEWLITEADGKPKKITAREEDA